MNLRKSFLITIFAVCIGCILNVKVYASTIRLEGTDRYKTSIEISKSQWKDGSSQGAILATGENYPDALSAAPLAQKINAPILLTNKDQLNSDTEAELKRLGVKTIYIIGGTGVISPAVESKLKSMKIDVIRLAGKDRYETSVKIAEQLDAPNQLAVTTGDDFSDALSIAPFAVMKNMPIILVPKGYVPDCVKKYVSSVKIDKTYIVGGTDIISDDVSKSFSNPYRIIGSDEYQRNIQIIKTFSNNIQWDTIYIATGNNFPDALSGSVIAGRESSPIVLVGNEPTVETKSFISENKAYVFIYKVLGGEGAVSSATLNLLLPAIDVGTVHGSTYTNSEIGFKLTWPDGWTPDSSNLTSDESSRDLLALDNSNSKCPYHDLMCTACDLGTSSTNFTSKDFASDIEDNLEADENYTVDRNISSQTIGGKDFEVIDLKYKEKDGTEVNQKIYCIIINNYTLTFLVTYTDTDSMNNIRNVLNTLEFTK